MNAAARLAAAKQYLRECVRYREQCEVLGYEVFVDFWTAALHRAHGKVNDAYMRLWDKGVSRSPPRSRKVKS